MSSDVQSVSALRNLFYLYVAALCLTACSTDKITLDSGQTVHQAIDAATGPLEDLNLRQREIPPMLLGIATDPYAPPKKVTCVTIRQELAQLDELLGSDIKPAGVDVAANDDLVATISEIDEVELPETETVTNEGISFAENFMMDTIRSHTNILPFRSIVRYLSGANAHQRKLEHAYAAGKLRRAYLKGVAQSRFGRKCDVRPAAMPQQNISI